MVGASPSGEYEWVLIFQKSLKTQIDTEDLVIQEIMAAHRNEDEVDLQIDP